jgi:glycosyltransferase involved in cell wall biosynthesis
VVDKLLELLCQKSQNDPTKKIDITIINDGSKSKISEQVFTELASRDIFILNLSTNLGKGGALKRGLEHAQYCGKEYVVTADADGQHLPEDILRVLKDGINKKTKVVMGGREFDSSTPARSRFGNLITKKIFHWMHSDKIDDTQTGLRFIPSKFFDRLIALPMNKYDFELAALILFAKDDALSEIKIQTIYEPGNPSSHFRKMRDSAKIYFVLFRGALTSCVVSALDYLTFMFTSMIFESTLLSVSAARIVSAVLYFYLARDFVFKSKARKVNQLTKFFALISVNTIVVSYLIDIATDSLGWPKIVLYIALTAPIFFINFYIQKKWIFNDKN